VFGLGAESMIVAITTALAKWFRGKEFAFAFGLNLTIARFGSFAADRSPSWFEGAFSSWQSPLLISVGFGSTCLIGAGLYLLIERATERRYQLGAEREADKVELRTMFSFGRTYWYVVALCFTFYSAVFPFRTFANKYFQESRGIPRDQAGELLSYLPLAAMFATPLFGLLADKIGRRATLMVFGSLLMLPVFLLMGYSELPIIVPLAMLGIAFSLIPAIMWPSVAYLVEGPRLGTAYGLMTLIQNVGLMSLNFVVGAANDAAGASAANPSGYGPMIWIFSGLAVIALAFSVLLWLEEKGPRAHGLETITTKAPG
jgi:predicted MFS family arabinose efflux permease